MVYNDTIGFGRHRGVRMPYEEWYARCNRLLNYKTNGRLRCVLVSYNWYDAYHRYDLYVPQAVNEALGMEEETEIYEIPMRENPDSFESALEG